MASSRWLAGLSSALAFAIMVGPAWSDLFTSVRSLADTTTALRSQHIAYRTCTIQGGVRRCRWVNTYGPGSYGYKAPESPPPASYGYRNDYHPTDPNAYPTGSRYWWRDMDIWDKGGSQQ